MTDRGRDPPPRRFPPRLSSAACALAAALSAAGCVSQRPRPPDPLEERAAAIACEVGPLELASLPQGGPAAAGYLAHADALDEGYRFAGRRILGTVEAGDSRIGVALLLPPAGPARGTIVAFHGYMSHGGRILGALERLADSGWAVLGANLPGHGFSDGKRGDIRDFEDYGRVPAGLLSWAEGQSRYSLPRPFVLLGHSLGAAAILEGLWSQGARPDAAILVAPLVKPVAFWAAPLADLIAPLVGSFASRKDDDGYLGLPRMPIHWVQALELWNRRAQDSPELELPVLIIQGTRDEVVDWRANLRLLERKLPRARVVYLPGRGHELLEKGKAREESLAAIGRFLDEQWAPTLSD